MAHPFLVIAKLSLPLKYQIRHINCRPLIECGCHQAINLLHQGLSATRTFLTMFCLTSIKRSQFVEAEVHLVAGRPNSLVRNSNGPCGPGRIWSSAPSSAARLMATSSAIASSLFYFSTLIKTKQSAHTPDLYYETSNYRSFVEIKWEADARAEKNEIRWPSIGLSVAALGFRYEVLTERHILRRPLADNVSELLRFRRFEPVSANHRDCITGILRRRPLSLGDVVSLLPSVEMAGLYRGLVDGWLSTNLEAPLSEQSILRLSEARRQNQ